MLESIRISRKSTGIRRKIIRSNHPTLITSSPVPMDAYTLHHDEYLSVHVPIRYSDRKSTLLISIPHFEEKLEQCVDIVVDDPSNNYCHYSDDERSSAHIFSFRILTHSA